LLPQVDSDDILEFGLIPELVGRLPVLSSLQPLDEAALVKVLTEPKNALVKQYQKMFGLENCTLEFTNEALGAIARKAMKKETGARGLRRPPRSPGGDLRDQRAECRGHRAGASAA